MKRSFHFSGLLVLVLAEQTAAQLSVRGAHIYDGGTKIKFKGIGLTCTEYMLKEGMDQACKGEYPSHWAFSHCFGGLPSNQTGAQVQLNDEVGHVLNFLAPDSHGGTFQTRPTVQKVSMGSTYDSVVNPERAESRPITRIPLTGSLVLYEGHPDIYRAILDQMVDAFTSRGVAVILDLHWNCPDSTTMGSCTGAQAAPMALRRYGEMPGSLELWAQLSKRYAGNSLVMYELFNEPWIMTFPTWYSGDIQYVGMKEMYDTIRANNPEGLVIIGGKDQYALDAQSGLAFYLQYREDTGHYPHNVLWNVHPYVGGSQGLEHSILSSVRLALALQTIGPVIFTEFGQYCCGGSKSSCKGKAQCGDHKHGDNFVHNVVNMAEQFDISWVGWAWRGANFNDANRPCLDGMAECGQPDIRDVDTSTGRVVLTNGERGGADWTSVWTTYVSPADGHIQVQDAGRSDINVSDFQPSGFLPRPCIAEQFNMGNLCGWDGDTDVKTLKASDFTGQSVYTAILPGLPGSCESQGCGGQKCDSWMGPCKGKGMPSWSQQPQPKPQWQQTPPPNTPAPSIPMLAPNTQWQHTPPATTPARTNSGAVASAYQQCGGTGFGGPFGCETGCECKNYGGDYYSQCVPLLAAQGQGACSSKLGAFDASYPQAFFHSHWWQRPWMTGFLFGCVLVPTFALVLLAAARVRHRQDWGKRLAASEDGQFQPDDVRELLVCEEASPELA